MMYHHIFISIINPLTNSEEIQEAINEIGNKEMNRNIPWWDIHVIDCNLDDHHNDYKSVVVFRCDHCLGDGATLLKFLIPQLLSDSDGNGIEFDIKPRKPDKLSW